MSLNMKSRTKDDGKRTEERDEEGDTITVALPSNQDYTEEDDTITVALPPTKHSIEQEDSKPNIVDLTTSPSTTMPRRLTEVQAANSSHANEAKVIVKLYIFDATTNKFFKVNDAEAEHLPSQFDSTADIEKLYKQAAANALSVPEQQVLFFFTLQSITEPNKSRFENPDTFLDWISSIPGVGDRTCNAFAYHVETKRKNARAAAMLID